MPFQHKLQLGSDQTLICQSSNIVYLSGPNIQHGIILTAYQQHEIALPVEAHGSTDSISTLS